MITRPLVGGGPSAQSNIPDLYAPPVQRSQHVSYHFLGPLTDLGDDEIARATPSQEDILGPPFKKQKLKIAPKPLNWDRGMGKSECSLLIDGHRKSSDFLRQPNPAFMDKEFRVSRPPIFASRPWEMINDKNTSKPDSVNERTMAKEPVSTRSYKAEASSSAPRYHEAGPVDFSPWSGCHAEDVLNELTTRNGFYDKIQASQNESGTARPSVWSSLKYSSGVHFLSSLFTLTLDRRQLRDTISTTNTFKPPPRVTLTDTKREAWLRDLSNPSIPLRRLSRTIPHGVRGKPLLEHCSNKEIPISRAIWLTKCVGANEIRAFKRKSPGGGATKWIKEWTSIVEQHLATIIETCDKGSKSQTYYSVRLVSCLFSEQLLDQQHYLDWLLTCLAQSDLDQFPVWLLVTIIHWQDIMDHRNFARRMAEAILEHLHALRDINVLGTYESILRFSITMVKRMLVYKPACFLLPYCWDKFSVATKAHLTGKDATLSIYFTDLATRTSKFQDSSARRPTHAQDVIRLLDSLSEAWDFELVAQECIRSSYDHAMLVTSCLEWCSTLYRRDRFRVYAAARLLRIWNRRAIRVQEHILNFISENAKLDDLNKPSIYKLLSELTLSGDFSLGKYLQWLMARVTLRECQRPDSNGPCDIRLLFELPLHGQPAHVINLRNSILATLKAPASEEDDLLRAVEKKVSVQTLGFFGPSSTSFPGQQYDGDFSQLAQTTKAAVAHGIRAAMSLNDQSNYLGSSHFKSQDHTTNLGPRAPSMMSLVQYHAIRNVLEQLDELPVLADILNIMCSISKGTFLTALADTINFHFGTLQALGAADGLFACLYKSLKGLSGDGLPETAFLESLLDLGNRLCHATQEVGHLHHKLSSLEPRLSAAACSPISDTMVEAMHSTESSIAGEIDQMLSSGTSMDTQTLSRVFESTTKQIEQSRESSRALIRLSNILGRLRGFNGESFDMLAKRWLEVRLVSLEQLRLSKVLPPLICAKVFSLQNVLEQTYTILGAREPSRDNASIALDILRLILEDNAEEEGSEDYRSYRMQDSQRRVLGLFADLILKILDLAVQACASDDVLPPDILETLKSPPFISLLRLTLNQAAGNAISVPSLSARTRRIIGAILLERDSGQRTPVTICNQVSRLLEGIHHFNASLCRLQFEAIMNDANLEDAARAMSDAFIEKIGCMSKSQIDLWARIVSGLSTNHASTICEWVVKAIISGFRSAMELNAEAVPDHSERLLMIIEAAASSIASDKDTLPPVEQISEALSILLSSHLLSGPQSTRYVGILLRLVAIYRVVFRQSEKTQETLIHLTLSLGCLLLNPTFATQNALSLQIFDAFAVFSDLRSHKDRPRDINLSWYSQNLQDSRLLSVYKDSSNNKSEGESLWLVPRPGLAYNAHEDDPWSDVTTQLYDFRTWENMQDATPVIGENDSVFNLCLFATQYALL